MKRTAFILCLPLPLALFACDALEKRPSAISKPLADHGPDPDSIKSGNSQNSEIAAGNGPSTDPLSKPDDTVTIPPSTGIPPPGETLKAKVQAMLKEKKISNEYDVKDNKGWGTTKAKPIELLVAVDAKGRAIVPAGVKLKQIEVPPDPTQEPAFQDVKGAVNSLHSSLRVCNKGANGIYLHAVGATPFSHGTGPIAPGRCAKFLVEYTDTLVDNASYDHALGMNSPYIYYKIIKIKPDGSME